MKARVLLVLAVLVLSWSIEASQISLSAAADKPNKKPRKYRFRARVLPGKYEKAVMVPKGDPRAYPPGAAPGGAVDSSGDTVPLLKLVYEDNPTLCSTEKTVVRKAPVATADAVVAIAAGEKVQVTSPLTVAQGDDVWVAVTAKGISGFTVQRLLDSCSGGSPSPDSSRMPRQLQAAARVATGAGGYPLFKQCDALWKNQALGQSRLPICSAGCALSSVAMILAKRGLNYNPSTLNSWLKSHGGFSGALIVWGAVDKLGKTRCLGYQRGSYQQVCDWIKAGRGVIGNVNGGGHYVVLTGCDGKGNYMVNDPGFSRSTYRASAVVKTMVYQ